MIYRELGLKFSFSGNEVKLGIYLVDTRMHYSFKRYIGKLSRGLSGNWKLKKFAEQFPEFELTESKVILTGRASFKVSQKSRLCSLLIEYDPDPSL